MTYRKRDKWQTTNCFRYLFLVGAIFLYYRFKCSYYTYDDDIFYLYFRLFVYIPWFCFFFLWSSVILDEWMLCLEMMAIIIILLWLLMMPSSSSSNILWRFHHKNYFVFCSLIFDYFVASLRSINNYFRFSCGCSLLLSLVFSRTDWICWRKKRERERARIRRNHCNAFHACIWGRGRRLWLWMDICPMHIHMEYYDILIFKYVLNSISLHAGHMLSK